MAQYKNKICDIPAQIIDRYLASNSDDSASEEQSAKTIKEAKAAIKVLEHFRLIEEFKETLNKLKWEPYLVNIRHFYYCKQIKKTLERICFNPRKKIKVLEIGGGDGTLNVYLQQYFDIELYLNCDLPEMVLLNLAQLLDAGRKPDTVCYDECPSNIEKFKSPIIYSSPKKFMMENSNIELFGQFGLILNVNSFQEMDEQVRDNYITKCEKFMGKGANFWHLNWVTKNMSNIDGTRFENTPNQYSYPKSLDFFKFTEDDFCKNNDVQKKPSFEAVLIKK